MLNLAPASESAEKSAPKTRRASVCFVAPNMYSQLSDGESGAFIGGAEVQLTLLARALAERGRRVSAVTWDHGQADGVEHHQVRVFKTCGKADGIPVLRFVYPRLTSLWSAMRRADADVYVHRTADSDTGLVAAWAVRNRRKFFFSVASDTDCLHELPRLPTRRQRALYRYGLNRADCVLAQTRVQQRLLREQFGIEARLIRPCAPQQPAATPLAGEPGAVLWIGRFSPVKRLELCLEVAALCPELKFDIVGDANNEGDYTRRLRELAAQRANVTLHGHVPHAEVGRFYERALAVLCTSAWEGFPNTFLEAWSRGVPTVSTVEPDDAISGHGLGAVRGEAAGLAEALRGLARDDAARQACGRAASAYFAEHHRLEQTVRDFEALLEQFA